MLLPTTQATPKLLASAARWAKRPVRLLGLLVLLLMPQACAFCIHDPINPQAKDHTSFCAQYYREGKLVEAEARCRLAREFAPKYAEPVNLLGLIEYSRGHLDLARNYYKEALALKEDFAEAHNNLGRCPCSAGSTPTRWIRSSKRSR